MEIKDNFKIKTDGEAKWTMTVDGKPEIFGVIEKEWNQPKTKHVFSIKYYWNKVFQDKVFGGDDLETAKDKLKDILTKVDNQVKHMETSFENFKNELPII